MRIDAVGRTSRVCPGEPRASRRGRGRTPRVCRPSPTARRSRRSAPPCHGGSACAAPWWWESTSSVGAGSRRRRATGRGRGRNTADTAQRRARVGGRWISKIHAPQSRLDQRALRERRRGRHVSGRRATGCAPRRTRRRLFSPSFSFTIRRRRLTLAMLYNGRDVSLYGAYRGASYYPIPRHLHALASPESVASSFSASTAIHAWSAGVNPRCVPLAATITPSFPTGVTATACAFFGR